MAYTWLILRNTSQPSQKMRQEIQSDLKRELPNLGQFLVLSVLLAILTNMDIVLAPAFFDKETAGIYAGVSVLAKFMMFVIGAIDTVYYPRLSGESNISIFRKQALQAG